jgi:hypothetical protein
MLVVVGFVTLGGAQSAAAQGTGGGAQVKLGEGLTLTISGFLNATWFVNSGFFDPAGFGQGQSAEWANAVQPAADRLFQGAEIRNTRINFTFTAPPVIGKWSPRAVLEADFFGSFGGSGGPPFGDEQPQLRARFAYVDLTNGRTTIRIGQYWSPLFGEVPVSVTHLAFPLGYGAGGMIGWRYPGIYLYHDLNPGKPTTMQLVLSAFEGSGPAVPAAPGTPATVGQGEASAVPQFEARLNLTHRKPKFSWTAYVVGHLDTKDTSAVGVESPSVTGSAFEAGLNVTSGKFTIHGNAYTGKNIGQQFGHITQQVTAAGDVKGWGGWAQAGYELTPHWGAWLFYGMDDPDDGGSPGLTGNFRSKNEDLAGMLRYRAGRYQLGLEYFRANTTWATAGEQHASQVALSVMYTL